MKKSLLVLSVFALLFGTFYSCKKDGKSGSSTQPLTQAVWTFQKFDYQQSDGGPWTPDPDAIDANKFTIDFNTNGTYTEIESGGRTSIGTWNFSSNNTVLTISGEDDMDAANYTVSQLNGSSLILIEPSNSSQPGSYLATKWTFTH